LGAMSRSLEAMSMIDAPSIECDMGGKCCDMGYLERDAGQYVRDGTSTRSIVLYLVKDGK
jgi:hypothetical protein